MPRYKPIERASLLLPVILAEQIQPGTFEFALDHLVDHELDLSALDARFRNDEVGASAYDPRVMLKIVLLGYSRGLISSRGIERACRENVLFMAISGDSQPSYTHIAKFVRELGEQVRPLFTQVLLTCDRQGLIGRQMFAVDGLKLPSNASKERSGTHAELRHRAERLDRAAGKLLEMHCRQDEDGEEGQVLADPRQRIEALGKEAQATRELLAREQQRRNRMGKELKSNVTDNASAMMATSKGVIQGYAAQAAVDDKAQVIVAAMQDVQAMAQRALFRGTFRRDLKDSDALHWGEGEVSVGRDAISLDGKLAPGPDYKLYLSPQFVETETDFMRLKPRMVRVGDVKTFENFIVPIPAAVDPAAFDTVVVWCEAFSQFISAALQEMRDKKTSTAHQRSLSRYRINSK